MAADVQTLIEQYKVQFTNASQKAVDVYSNAPQHMETLKQKVTDLQPTVQEWADTTQNVIKNQVVDMTPVGVEMGFHKTVLEIYTLVGVSVFVSGVGNVVGNAFFGWLIGMVFSTNYALTLSFVVLPLATVSYIRKTDLSKEDRNTVVIASAFCRGMLNGFILSSRYLSIIPPPTFVLPLTIGASSVFLGPTMGNQPRTNLIGASIGAATAVFLACGLTTGSLGGTYFLWMILLAGVGFLDYQLKLAQIYEGNLGLGSLAALSISMYTTTGFLLTGLFGSPAPQNNDDNE